MSRKVRRNPGDYIKHLQQQNRLKRQRELSELQKRQLTVQREVGFQVYLRGANETRVKDHRIREQVQRRRTPGIRQRWVPNLRPTWGKPATPLMFKETAHTGSTESLSTNSPESVHAINSLATAGTFALRQLSVDLNSLTTRINKLSERNRAKMMNVLNELEAEEEVPEPCD